MQDPRGGLVDKPGKSRDFYHTCYALSGLSVAQHSPYKSEEKEEPILVGGDVNLLVSRISEVVTKWVREHPKLNEIFFPPSPLVRKFTQPPLLGYTLLSILLCEWFQENCYCTSRSPL